MSLVLDRCNLFCDLIAILYCSFVMVVIYLIVQAQMVYSRFVFRRPGKTLLPQTLDSLRQLQALQFRSSLHSGNARLSPV